MTWFWLRGKSKAWCDGSQSGVDEELDKAGFVDDKRNPDNNTHLEGRKKEKD